MALGSIARLHALAAEKGYAVERAAVRKCWRLRHQATGELARTPTGTAVFTVGAAIEFLQQTARRLRWSMHKPRHGPGRAVTIRVEGGRRWSAMLLVRGEYLGHILDRGISRFTMLNGRAAIYFAVTWALMDDLEGGSRAGGTRDFQFHRLRDRIERIAERKFSSIQDVERRGEIVLRLADRKI